MKRLAFVIVILSPGMASAATDVDILRDACGALKLPAKKAECIAALGRVAPQSGVKGGASDDRMIDAAKQRVLAMLNDPDSAKFRSATYSDKTKAVCGVLSAKNSMGGYGAPSRFIVTQEFARVEQARDPGFDYRWSELCDEG